MEIRTMTDEMLACHLGSFKPDMTGRYVHMHRFEAEQAVSHDSTFRDLERMVWLSRVLGRPVDWETYQQVQWLACHMTRDDTTYARGPAE